jgi:glycosyltransferase involved in cell wall biosynthesis
MEIKEPKILLIGPCYSPEKRNVGGATLSFGFLVDYFNEKSIKFQLLDSQKYKGVKGFLYLLFSSIRYAPKNDVVFMNTSQKGIKYFAPIVYVLAKALSKKIIFRPFGGALKAMYEDSSVIGKWFFKSTIFKADILYLQTKILMNFFVPRAKNCIQLKTARNQPDKVFVRPSIKYRKRFLFVGHVKQSKGIDELIQAIEMLDDSYVLDIYGPIGEQKYQYLLDEKKTYYKGILSGEEQILSTLKDYDVLILPTYYEGEGYPGAIIEAYSVGLPVIATNWKSLPEIIEDNKTGFLVETKNSKGLKRAIEKFDQENYSEMSENAKQYYLSNFQVNLVMDKVMKDINNIL